MNFNIKIASVGFSALLALAASHADAQATLAQWSFETPSNTIAVNNSPAPSTGTGTASALGMGIYSTPGVGVNTDDVLAGASGDTGANGVADLSQVWRVRAQKVSGGTAANGWSSLAPIGTQGAEFAVPTTGATGPITVSFDWYATTQGEANLQLEYTTNASAATPTWNNVALTLGGSDSGLVALTNSTSANTVTGAYVSDNLLVNGSQAGQDWFTGLKATISDPLAVNDPNFAIEMVNASTGADDLSTQGTALNNSSGNWRFDNVTVTAAAVPEPSSWVLAAIVAGAFVMLRRRASRVS